MAICVMNNDEIWQHLYSVCMRSSCYALQAVPRGSRDGELMNMR